MGFVHFIGMELDGLLTVIDRTVRDPICAATWSTTSRVLSSTASEHAARKASFEFSKSRRRREWLEKVAWEFSSLSRMKMEREKVILTVRRLVLAVPPEYECHWLVSGGPKVRRSDFRRAVSRVH